MVRERIVIAGGSGFLGGSLSDSLIADGNEVVVLSRRAVDARGPARHVQWDGRSLGDWVSALDGAKALVNLTGRSVNCRYSRENRREIIDSRINSVNILDRAITQCAKPPRVWVQAGSLAIYGNAGDRLCDETASPGDGFSVNVCQQWENAFNDVSSRDIRRVFLRIGFVLGPDGGILTMLANLTRRFMGGTVGNGRQYISWLHIDDLNQIFRWALDREQMTGVFNATSPEAVTNAEFMAQLRKVLHRPWTLPTPAWAVHIGTWLMRTEASLALTGRRCVLNRLQEIGFEFKHRDLSRALANIYQCV